MTALSRTMHLGVFMLGTGHHVSGWRLQEAQAGAENMPLLTQIARTNERGKFNLLFLADALNTGPNVHPSVMVRLEPITLLSSLAMVTSRIGLAATASTTYTEPYNLARYFGSLDHISAGRAGWNIVTGAFAEAAGRDLAASAGEAIFAVHQDLSAAVAFRGDLRSRAARFGRDLAHLKIMPGVYPIIGGSEHEARERLAELGNFLDPAPALQVLPKRLGHDLAGCDLDVPVPELPASGIMLRHAVTLMAMARQDNLTLRQLRDITAAAMGHRRPLRTPKQVADGLEAWFNAGAADGFNIMPPWFAGAFDDFVDQVVPILGKRGLFRAGCEGKTLRKHLGLPRSSSMRADRLSRASAGSELST